MAFLLESQMPVTALEPSRQKLVLSVIEEYHGPIVKTVAEVLMRADRTTLADLTRLVQRDQGIMGVSRAGKTKTKVTAANVKESLLIMTQHNMVSAEMPTEREMRRARANASAGAANATIRMHYTLLPLEVLVRTRGPQFHSHASSTFSKVAGLIVDCFLRHGRRTLPDVKEELLSREREATRARKAQQAGACSGADEEEEDEDEEMTAEDIQKSFEELVMGKYIDKVAKLDLVNPTVEPEKAKKPSMTFGAPSGSTNEAKGNGSSNGKASGVSAGPNGKNTELAARQQKGAAQTHARKRRILGHDSTGSSGMEGGANNSDDSDDEDELPVEMRNMVNMSMGSMGAGFSGGAAGNDDDRPPPAKRKKVANGLGSGDDTAGRARGRGRSRGRGTKRGGLTSYSKGKEKGGLDMDGVFREEGDESAEDEEHFGLERGTTASKGKGKAEGVGATVLDGVVWRLGVDKFHRDFRNSSLLGLVQDRFPKSKLAYLAVKVMLDNSSPTERKVDEQVSASISARTLFDKLCQTWKASNFTKNKAVPDWRRFVSWMSALCTDLTSMVSKIPGSDVQNPRYVVNIGKMVQYIRSNLVKCTVRDRYGKETARIVEILLQNKFLDQQQVGEMAMIPPSDARERLYRLLRDRMVSVQEVPKRADRNPNTTFYLWTIKHDQVAQVVLDSLYKAMLNMRLRRKFVFTNDKELFIHDAAARLSNDAERERLDQVRRSLDRLDTALLRLDENLMFFNTF
eukprot:g4630.t1